MIKQQRNSELGTWSNKLSLLFYFIIQSPLYYSREPHIPVLWYYHQPLSFRFTSMQLLLTKYDGLLTQGSQNVLRQISDYYYYYGRQTFDSVLDSCCAPYARVFAVTLLALLPIRITTQTYGPDLALLLGKTLTLILRGNSTERTFSKLLI